MQRIDHPTAAAAKPDPMSTGDPGYFTEGSPAGGIPATVVTADFLNQVQEELIAVILAGQLIPNKLDTGQVLAAIRKLVGDAVQGGASPTGQFANFMRKTAPPGWVRTGINIAKTGANAAYANDDAENLFKLLWNDWPQSLANVSGGRGASASADWSAGKSIAVPDMSGYFPRTWNQNSGGIDGGRAFGTTQLDAMQRITGTYPNDWSPAGNVMWRGAFKQVVDPEPIASALNAGGGTGDYLLKFDSGNSDDVRIASENRPVNRALLGCVKL